MQKHDDLRLFANLTKALANPALRGIDAAHAEALGQTARAVLRTLPDTAMFSGAIGTGMNSGALGAALESRHLKLACEALERATTLTPANIPLANPALASWGSQQNAMALWDAFAQAHRAINLMPTPALWTQIADLRHKGWHALADILLAYGNAHPNAQGDRGGVVHWTSGIDVVRAFPSTHRRQALETLAVWSLDRAPDEACLAAARATTPVPGLVLMRLRPKLMATLYGHLSARLATPPKTPRRGIDGMEALATALGSAHARLATQTWTWDPLCLLEGPAESADRRARKLLGLPQPSKIREDRKRANQAARGRARGPKGGAHHPGAKAATEQN